MDTWKVETISGFVPYKVFYTDDPVRVNDIHNCVFTKEFRITKLTTKDVESAFHHVGIAPCKPAVIPIVEF